MTYPPPDPTLPDPSGYPGQGYTTPPGYSPQQPQPSYQAPTAPPQPTYPPQPGYPQAGYPQQAYPQAAYPGAYYNPSAQTNTMAILSLVFAFVFSPLGIVFGHIARKQIRERGEGGSGVATAGLWCSYIFTSLSVLLCGIYIVVIAVAVNSSSTY